MINSLFFKTLITGIATAGLYIGLFANQDIIMEEFTRGGAYAAWPILTAFVFSIVHGAFASYLLSLMGIQARSSSK